MNDQEIKFFMRQFFELLSSVNATIRPDSDGEFYGINLADGRTVVVEVDNLKFVEIVDISGRLLEKLEL